MEDIDLQVQTASFDLTLNATLSWLRLIHAHVVPVAKSLDAAAVERKHLMAGIEELQNLHLYLTNCLNQLTTGIRDPVAAAQAVMAGAQGCVDQIEAQTKLDSATPDAAEDDRKGLSIH